MASVGGFYEGGRTSGASFCTCGWGERSGGGGGGGSPSTKTKKGGTGLLTDFKQGGFSFLAKGVSRRGASRRGFEEGASRRVFEKGGFEASPGHIYKDLPEASGEGAMPREKKFKAEAEPFGVGP